MKIFVAILFVLLMMVFLFFIGYEIREIVLSIKKRKKNKNKEIEKQDNSK